MTLVVMPSVSWITLGNLEVSSNDTIDKMNIFLQRYRTIDRL
jgi:hypothetical protein